MSHVMNARKRDLAGKGAARRLRLAGEIPAVIYGAGEEPVAIAINGHDLLLTLQKGGFFTNVQNIKVDGKDQKVLARDVQRHPVSDKILHIDFLRFDANKTLSVNVHVEVVGADENEALKAGGVLNMVRSEVELLCRADSIPDSIKVSVAGVGVGESVHISEVELPEGVRPVQEHDFTLVGIVPPKGGSSGSDEADEAEEDAEGTEEGAEAQAEGEDQTAEEEKSDS